MKELLAQIANRIESQLLRKKEKDARCAAAIFFRGKRGGTSIKKKQRENPSNVIIEIFILYVVVSTSTTLS